MAVNDELLDLAISHEHYAERFKTKEAYRIQRLLSKMDNELQEKLMKNDITKWSKKRYEKIQKELMEVKQSYIKVIDESFQKNLKDFGAQEAMLQKKRVDKVAGPYLQKAGVSYTTPSPTQLWTAAQQTPLLLQENLTWNLKTMTDSIGQKATQAIEQSLRYSYAMGESIPEAKRRLLGTATRAGAMKSVKNSAEMVVRTSMNHMSSVSRTKTYEDNDDIVKGYEWVSTLDRRTSDICQWRDGRVWLYSDDEKVRTKAGLLSGEVMPPAHPNCRSTTIPVLKSWKELGIEYKDVNVEERASMNGQVPGKLTYHEWLKRQNSALQKEVLGATRYELWKQGKLSMDQMYSSDGQKLTLEQLRKKSEGSLQTAYANPWEGTEVIDNNTYEAIYSNRRRRIEEFGSDEVKVIDDYIDFSYEPINGGLRTGKLPEDLKYNVSTLDSMIDSSDPIGGSWQVYRGGEAYEELKEAGWKPGSIITDRGYLSTSTNADVAEEFAVQWDNPVRVDISVPKGKKAIVGAQGEQELIFARDTKIIVDSIDEQDGGVFVKARMLLEEGEV